MVAALVGDGSQSNLPADQTAILRDLARNGTANDGNIFGFDDAQQSNGPTPHGYMFSEAHFITGLANSSNEDPAALLESLASYEHPPNEFSTPVSNDHFASLLQAAATAGGQEAHNDGGRARLHSLTESSPREVPQSQSNKEDAGRKFEFATSRTTKQERSASDEEADEARVREIWGPDEEEEEGEDHEEGSEDQQSTRKVGAKLSGTSAAALFRRPTTLAKKYSRPPMSIMFASLELSPEEFIRLQTAAKDYMLDPNHPERQDCVAHKGQPDTDMTRLKLFQCTKAFLDDEGWGERSFGENSAPDRKLKWPQMQNKIITLCIPLLRKMVSNERQRQYAIEARRRNAQAKKGLGRNETENQNGEVNGIRGLQSASPFPEIDPKLNNYHYQVETHGVTNDRPLADAFDVKYHVNILQNGRRIRPKAVLTPANCNGLLSLMAFFHNVAYSSVSEGHTVSPVKVLTPDGLVTVNDEEGWTKAVACVKNSDWMDGEVKCIIDLE